MLDQAIKICKPHYPNYPYVLHRDGRTVKSEGGAFYLTTNGYNVIFDQPNTSFPDLVHIQKPKPPINREEFEKPKEPAKNPNNFGLLMRL